MPITRAPFGRTDDGQAVDVFTLSTANVEARVMTHGAALISLRVPDRSGVLGDIVVGFDQFSGYLNDRHYLGAVIGRYANRIAEGRFSLNGAAVQLTRNSGREHLHGGARGFDKVIWDAACDGEKLVLSYMSRDGEEGYPGNLQAQVSYRLKAVDELEIGFTATTDRDTIVNLTHHAYFNLEQCEDLASHTLSIDGEAFLPIDDRLVPTGERREVRGTAMDFRAAANIASQLGHRDPQLATARGFDHTWILDKRPGAYHFAAEAIGQTSGRCLRVFTTQPGLHFYTANAFEGFFGKAGRIYRPHSSFCLEAQHYPDSPNQPDFPSTVLRAGERLQEIISYRFSVR